MPCYSGYLRIVRNGQDVSQNELNCIMNATFTESVMQGMERRTDIVFSLAGAVSSSENFDVTQGEFLEIMDNYIFGVGNSYDIYMGQDQAHSVYMMSGCIISVDVNFGEDGNIGFTVSITNAMVSNPDKNADENSSYVWPSGVTALQVLQKTVQDRKMTLSFPDPEVQSYLSGIVYTNGRSRPRGVTTHNFTSLIADECGLHIEETNGVVIVTDIYKVRRSEMYFLYRGDNVNIQPTDSAGVLLSFKPNFLPMGQGNAANVAGMDERQGTPVTKTTDSDNKQNPKNNKVFAPQRPTGSGAQSNPPIPLTAGGNSSDNAGSFDVGSPFGPFGPS